jgi:hypothetical protein
MSTEWLPIVYRDFHDIPRAFVVERAGQRYFFDCPFDDARDEFPEKFRVYALPADLREQLEDSWIGLHEVGQLLGTVAVDAVQFDESRRARIRAAALDQITRF